MIVKFGSKWKAQSESGKSLGVYGSKGMAERRLKQVEMLKKMGKDKALKESQVVREAMTSSKMARLQRGLEIELRQLHAKGDTDPKRAKEIMIAMEAIGAISSDKGLTDGKVAGMAGNKYPRLLRSKELALRGEVLKGKPSIPKIAEIYMTVKGLNKFATDKSSYDTRQNTQSQRKNPLKLKEMSVGGIAGADATSQGPLVWGDKGPGLMKTSPFGKVSGKSDDTKKSKTKVDIDSKEINESEVSDDLKAMYGESLTPSQEDVQSAAYSEDYVAGELLKLRAKNADKSRRDRFIIDSLRDRKVLESAGAPRKVVVNEAKESKVNAAGNYTKPGMRKRLFKKIMAGTKGGDPGEWSARKAQLLAREYKKSGGGYKN